MKVKFTDIIDSILLGTEDPDNYIHGVKRELVIKHALRSLQDLHWVGDKVFKEAEGEMNKVGKFRMPDDFVDYVRIFFVVNGYLVPALYNDQINTWYSYMLENDDIVAAININDNEDAMILDNKDYEIIKGADLGNMKSKYCMLRCKSNGYLYGKNGYKFDHRDNTLTFDEVPEGYDRVLIQYVANVDFSDIDKLEVHEYFQRFIEADVYWRIIEQRRNVPMYEKVRAKQEKNRRHKDAMFMLNFKVEEFKQVLMS